MKNIIWTIIISISMFVLIWFSASYIEVISKNNTENPEYSPYNVFVLITKGE